MMWPPMGIIDIVSSPPATATSALPVLILSAAIAIDCNPEEQKRLIVIALVSTGRPARIAAARATFIPCSASGLAQPMITSSISDASRPGTRAMAALMAAAPMSSGRVSRRVPFGALPTAVRTADTITASFMILFFLLSLPLGEGWGEGLPRLRSGPLPDPLPKGERESQFILVPQRFPRLQHMRNSIL